MDFTPRELAMREFALLTVDAQAAALAIARASARSLLALPPPAPTTNATISGGDVEMAPGECSPTPVLAEGELPAGVTPEMLEAARQRVLAFLVSTDEGAPSVPPAFRPAPPLRATSTSSVARMAPTPAPATTPAHRAPVAQASRQPSLPARRRARASTARPAPTSASHAQAASPAVASTSRSDSVPATRQAATVSPPRLNAAAAAAAPALMQISPPVARSSAAPSSSSSAERPATTGELTPRQKAWARLARQQREGSVVSRKPREGSVFATTTSTTTTRTSGNASAGVVAGRAGKNTSGASRTIGSSPLAARASTPGSGGGTGALTPRQKAWARIKREDPEDGFDLHRRALGSTPVPAPPSPAARGAQQGSPRLSFLSGFASLCVATPPATLFGGPTTAVATRSRRNASPIVIDDEDDELAL